MSVNCIEHPLIDHKLSLMRDKNTKPDLFRRLVREVAILLAYEVTRDLPLEKLSIDTPLETMQAPFLSGKKPCLISILRAGNGMLDGVLQIIPTARVGHIGLYRDHETLEAIEYYVNVPGDLGERLCIVVDPMLGTANTAIAAVELLKQEGAKKIKFMCLFAAPSGIEAFERAFPDVELYTVAIDRELNDHGYLLPGVGDAGDRIFGTL